MDIVIYQYFLNFNAWDVLFNQKFIIAYCFLLITSVWGLVDFLGTIYSIKKSDKAMKIIAKQYSIIQRLLLIHYYQNIYKKVDRLFFNFIYKVYIFNLFILFVSIVCVILSLYWDIFNQISCVILMFHVVLMIIATIVEFFATRLSPLGGREFRSEAKYRGKKNW